MRSSASLLSIVTYFACYRFVKNLRLTTFSLSSDRGSFLSYAKDLLKLKASPTSIFNPSFLKKDPSYSFDPSLMSLCTLSSALSLHLSAMNSATKIFASSMYSSTSCLDYILGDSFQLIGYMESLFSVKLNSLFTNSMEPASNLFLRRA